MRRLGVVFALMAILSTVAPAQSHIGSHPVTFTAGVPCTFACPEWLANWNTDLDGDGRDDIHFNECASPGPWTRGTAYDEVITEPMPVEADILVFEIDPSIDSDSFICELGDTWDEDGRPNEPIRFGVPRPLDQGCDNVLGNNSPVPVGCREKHLINTKDGKQVILRVYNWADVTSVEGTYTFRDVA